VRVGPSGTESESMAGSGALLRAPARRPLHSRAL